MHILEGFGMLLTTPFRGIEHFGFVVHESPIIFNECWRVYNDTTYLLSFNSKTITLKMYAVRVIKNLFWNNADLIAEALDTSNGLSTSDFINLGTNIGKITSDILIKNPTQNVWSGNNSNILANLSSPPLIVSGTPKVTNNPTT